MREKIVESASCFLKKHMFVGTGVIFGISLVLSLVFLYNLHNVKKQKGKHQEIANIIRKSSFVYLKTQYVVIGIVSLFIGAFVKYILGWEQVAFFFVGVISATIASFFGMNIATLANVATVEKAKHSLNESFSTAITASLSGSSFLTIISVVPVMVAAITEKFSQNLIALSMGVSFVSVFARLGGGIFTKGADVGADMVGKIEHSLEEDSPKNPAVIADCVGDNVGDIAGMITDLCESIIVAIASAIILNPTSKEFVLITMAFGIIGAIASVFLVRKQKPEKAVANFATVSFLVVAALTALLCRFGEVTNPMETFICFTIGLILSILVMNVTKYYTDPSFYPVKNMLEVSKSGHGSNVIQGLSYGYESTVPSALIVISGILICYTLNGLQGISIGIIGIMSMVTCFLTQDIFGPISDNAGGIAEMSSMPSEVRDRTDVLDAIGNTTKAVTKGYAIASALFASVLMFYLFKEDLHSILGITMSIDISDRFFLPSLLFGGIVPFAFCGISMRAVGEAAASVVKEVREQIHKHPGILEGTVEPDYEKTVKNLTNFSTKKMIVPALLPILAPIIAFLVGSKFGQTAAFTCLSLTLVGITVVGSLQSIAMITSGGLWDNTKKYFKTLVSEGKLKMDAKSEKMLKEAVIVGDTVGDPFKDTSGPSLNSVIKLASLTAILIVYSVA